VIRAISLAAVDLADHPFAAPSGANTSALAGSIRTVGLLNPPWLRAKGVSRWQVVAGLKRLRAAANLGWEAVSAHTLDAEIPDSQALLIALHDNAFSRQFTPWEQAFFARRLTSFWERSTVVQQFLPLLGLPPTEKHLDRLLAASSLEEAWQPLLAQGRLALTAAARLAPWPPADRLAALPFFQALPSSQSKQEEFLEWTELLARREGLTMTAVLSRPELASCLTDPALNPQEKAAAVRRRLKAWVFLRFTTTQKAWETNLARLGLKQHHRLRLTPPPAFEGPDFHLEIKFQNGAELRELLDELAEIADKKEFFNLTAL
jgi:ParB-like chromosome segregation protein Spo0J